MDNVPDNWVVIKITGDDPHYRVLAGWSGGYATGDSWKLNSGIIKCKDNGQSFKFIGSSGSVYTCGKESYGLRMNNGYIYDKLKDLHGDKIKLMDENTDWLKVNWVINN